MSHEVKSTGTGPVKVTVVGAGGNIGSHLVTHLARLPWVDEVLLVDPDVYQFKNLASQDIVEEDIGKPKVEVQRLRLQRIRPDLRVSAAEDRVENLPLGLLRADILVTCLDTRAARQAVNERVWWLGIPWVDAGVLADQLLARVSRFDPRQDTACLECCWSDSDYALIEQRYPCENLTESFATNAPSGLGALAAALQVLELQNYLGGAIPSPNAAQEFLVDARGQHSYSTSLRKNPACRFSHRTMQVRPMPLCGGQASIREIVEHHHAIAGEDCAATTLSVPGQTFAQQLACPNGCPVQAISLCILGRMPDALLCCPHCSARRAAPGFSTLTDLDLSLLAPSVIDRPVAAMGLRVFDVVACNAHDGDPSYYEIGYDSRD